MGDLIACMAWQLQGMAPTLASVRLHGHSPHLLSWLDGVWVLEADQNLWRDSKEKSGCRRSPYWVVAHAERPREHAAFCDKALLKRHVAHPPAAAGAWRLGCLRP